ncbi:hypothetical protein ACHAXS_013480 [Conticribra weissflogii]
MRLSTDESKCPVSEKALTDRNGISPFLKSDDISNAETCTKTPKQFWDAIACPFVVDKMV